MKLEKIKFEGKTWILCDGAITTKKDFENGVCGYAHLYNNDILRYGNKIGTRKDIEFTGEHVVVEPKVGIFELMASFIKGDKGW